MLQKKEMAIANDILSSSSSTRSNFMWNKKETNSKQNQSISSNSSISSNASYFLVQHHKLPSDPKLMVIPLNFCKILILDALDFEFRRNIPCIKIRILDDFPISLVINNSKMMMTKISSHVCLIWFYFITSLISHFGRFNSFSNIYNYKKLQHEKRIYHKYNEDSDGSTSMESFKTIPLQTMTTETVRFNK